MELDSRKLQILRAIVDEYILSASPVGSKSLSQNSKWSSATIRNEMADLETLGYLAQPHTSAGRIPSEKAYRLYVDQMMQHAHLSDDESKLLYGYFREHVHGVDAVLRETAKALSEITHYTAVVMMPDIGVNRLRHLQLIPLTTGKALAVVVTDAGVSQNTVIDVPADIGSEELDRISKSITARFQDCRMSTVSSSLVRELGGELSRRADFVESLLSALCNGQTRDRRMVELSGATNMLEYPEYSDVNKAKTFLATVEQKDDMYRMLKKASNMEFTVTIGSENEQEGFQDCSVVTASYRVNGTPVGSFGVIGPTRMDYARVLSILKNVQNNLSTVLQSFLKEE
ncbi:MAG: heat-inducible transcription repressor HrcA [Clostridia bacterium]|nr:heat-inducible transcription repressor HrcA [Clostridia bacterium]